MVLQRVFSQDMSEPRHWISVMSSQHQWSCYSISDVITALVRSSQLRKKTKYGREGL